ncbi:ABC transporter ATP-binding protein [Brevibacillus reuszeri]|uniref:ABC transporter n=1 Tax=Brevibacillus reuszeri TaxID=54915 RepID=A0A0K9YMM0_9BACL|nr:sugar ABC transporter ATP-binding protein [Brevibacillus reuszeri]KNB69964.1 ABC transporter [Brevibacillus reuszeri]MED1858331.1 sugar ABC transporter ATP-binding protein [Brevibacillus reuszeri]GED68671.1 ABC transporter ATP-binding protein [Brevibacillus reuszeri]
MSTLHMKGIVKQFSGVPALRSVQFEVKAGEVHALLGANGAGKSTLMKILTGAYQADGGTISIDGQEVTIQSPQDAKALGIQCVYQEVDTALVPYLSVAENILLDQLVSSKKKGLINWQSLYAESERILQGFGFSIPVKMLVEQCTLSEKQLILIARATVQKAKYVIFDEPTAPLSTKESERLFQIIAQLKSAGVGIIYISHRLPEIFEICDRITIMRDGQGVITTETAATNMDEVISHMLGKSFSEEFPKVEVPIGETVFEAKAVAGGKVRRADLHVKQGEIVGVVGLVGAGKTELARLLFGADSMEAGEISLKGKQVRLASPKDAVDAGIVLVPEERRKEGIFVEESVNHNLSVATLASFSPLGFIRKGIESRQAKDLVQKLGVKTADIAQLVGHLSGGNQQKVAIGKWLNTDSSIFMFDEPTKGVDIGAKSDIYRLIGKLAEQGKGVLYFSCEFQEVIGIADRILVMFEGKIVKELSRDEVTQELIMYYASGGE